MVETYILTRSSQFSNEHLVVDRTFPTRSSSWVLSSSSSSSPGLAILMGVCHEIFDPHFSIIPTTYFRIRFELPLFIIQIYSPMMDVFSHNRFLPVSSFKSDQRHAKFSILTPRCGFWLRGVDFDSAVWILTLDNGNGESDYTAEYFKNSHISARSKPNFKIFQPVCQASADGFKSWKIDVRNVVAHTLNN